MAEQAVAIWNSGLTKGQVNDLEKIQKVALKIILEDDYRSYDMACNQFNLKTLSDRRLDLCTNFAVKLFQSNRSEQFFTRSNRQVETRHEDPVLVKKCNTVRCYNAPHNYLSRLVNKNKDKVKTSTQ